MKARMFKYYTNLIKDQRELVEEYEELVKFIEGELPDLKKSLLQDELTFKTLQTVYSLGDKKKEKAAEQAFLRNIIEPSKKDKQRERGE